MRFLAFALSAMLALPALAGEKAGVTHPDDMEVNGKKLVLNGLGLREKTMFNVDIYVAALYVKEKTQDADKILGADEEKCICMKFVHDVEKDKMTDAWDEGFEKNAGDDADKLKDRIKKLDDWMADLKVGDSMTFTYIPGKGVEVKVKDEVKGTIEGWDFAKVFFAIWLGPEPPTDDLKNGLLGKE